MYANLSSRSHRIALRNGIAIARALRRLALSLLFTSALAATSSQAESSEGCPAHKPLTLAQVLFYIDSKSPEERSIQRIEACHIDFPIDAKALDKLTDKNASKSILDVLNRVSASQITFDQAHTQVAELQRRMEEIDKDINVDRDAAVQKSDSDYQSVHEKASHIDPKGPFESTADYTARQRDAKNKLASMEESHRRDVREIMDSFYEKARIRKQPYLGRITFLQQNRYPDSRAIAYTTYDPDSRQLKATVGGDDYLFERVPSQTAETLAKNWPSVRLLQPYQDDTVHTRFLVLAAIPAPVPGYSVGQKKSEALKDHLQRARQAAAKLDYDTAESEFKQVLQIDPTNQEAKTGFDAALAMIQKKNAFFQGLTDHGVWIDGKTSLMWTMKKSEHTMNWHAANDYCQALRLDGLAGWRLPTIAELKGIYDPAITKTKRTAVPGDSTYTNMKGPIDVTGMVVWIWSSTMSSQGGAISFWFDLNRTDVASLDSKVDRHALCVRAWQPATDGLDLPTATASPSSTHTSDSPHPNGSSNGHTVPELDATAKTPADQLERQGEAFFFDNQYINAFNLARKSCDQGSQDGCALEAAMYGRGSGVTQDIARSLTLANQSCDAGRARGCEVLGVAYYKGSGVARNQSRAAELFTASCRAGFSVACFDLGAQTLNGNGVKKDVPQAVELFRQSCSGGYKDACDELTALHERGIN